MEGDPRRPPPEAEAPVEEAPPEPEPVVTEPEEEQPAESKSLESELTIEVVSTRLGNRPAGSESEGVVSEPADVRQLPMLDDEVAASLRSVEGEPIPNEGNIEDSVAFAELSDEGTSFEDTTKLSDTTCEETTKLSDTTCEDTTVQDISEDEGLKITDETPGPSIEAQGQALPLEKDAGPSRTTPERKYSSTGDDLSFEDTSMQELSMEEDTGPLMPCDDAPGPSGETPGQTPAQIPSCDVAAGPSTSLFSAPSYDFDAPPDGGSLQAMDSNKFAFNAPPGEIRTIEEIVGRSFDFNAPPSGVRPVEEIKVPDFNLPEEQRAKFERTFDFDAPPAGVRPIEEIKVPDFDAPPAGVRPIEEIQVPSFELPPEQVAAVEAVAVAQAVAEGLASPGTHGRLTPFHGAARPLFAIEEVSEEEDSSPIISLRPRESSDAPTGESSEADIPDEESPAQEDEGEEDSQGHEGDDSKGRDGEDSQGQDGEDSQGQYGDDSQGQYGDDSQGQYGDDSQGQDGDDSQRQHGEESQGRAGDGAVEEEEGPSDTTARHETLREDDYSFRLGGDDDDGDEETQENIPEMDSDEGEVLVPVAGQELEQLLLMMPPPSPFVPIAVVQHVFFDLEDDNPPMAFDEPPLTPPADYLPEASSSAESLGPDTADAGTDPMPSEEVGVQTAMSAEEYHYQFYTVDSELPAPILEVVCETASSSSTSGSSARTVISLVEDTSGVISHPSIESVECEPEPDSVAGGPIIEEIGAEPFVDIRISEPDDEPPAPRRSGVIIQEIETLTLSGLLAKMHTPRPLAIRAPREGDIPRPRPTYCDKSTMVPPIHGPLVIELLDDEGPIPIVKLAVDEVPKKKKYVSPFIKMFSDEIYIEEVATYPPLPILPIHRPQFPMIEAAGSEDAESSVESVESINTDSSLCSPRESLKAHKSGSSSTCSSLEFPDHDNIPWTMYKPTPPLVLKSIRPHHDPEHPITGPCVLQVRGFGKNFKDHEIARIFGRYGTIERARVYYDLRRSVRGTAEVIFAEREQALVALEAVRTLREFQTLEAKIRERGKVPLDHVDVEEEDYLTGEEYLGSIEDEFYESPDDLPLDDPEGEADGETRLEVVGEEEIPLAAEGEEEEVLEVREETSTIEISAQEVEGEGGEGIGEGEGEGEGDVALEAEREETPDTSVEAEAIGPIEGEGEPSVEEEEDDEEDVVLFDRDLFFEPPLIPERRVRRKPKPVPKAERVRKVEVRRRSGRPLETIPEEREDVEKPRGKGDMWKGG